MKYYIIKMSKYQCLVVLRGSLQNIELPVVNLDAPVIEPDTFKPAQQRHKQLSDDERRRVIADYKSGATVYKLAEQFGCHRNTISRVLRTAGVRLRLDGLTSEQIDEAVRLYESGLPLVRIAKEFNSTANTVSRRLVERGVLLRDTHGRVKILK